ncbi:hypothetical protein BJV82DRAFT_675803 [Fennellomyces sp. T-0311]|nr:hypothetical protein BJV82DRAFT_675803 [Fennellomyces sp. T-0311]
MGLKPRPRISKPKASRSPKKVRTAKEQPQQPQQTYQDEESSSSQLLSEGCSRPDIAIPQAKRPRTDDLNVERENEVRDTSVNESSSETRGIETVEVTFCDCTPGPFTLLENQLFPASPMQPRVAFHLSFLDLYSELRVEGHLSCQAFAARFSTVNKFENPDTIRRALTNAFFEYIHVKEAVNLQLLTYEQQENGSSEVIDCPACPEQENQNERKMISLDGNFQLRRRKRNGQEDSAVIPEAHTFFKADRYQDIFGDNVEQTANIPNDSSCSSDLRAATLTITSR